MDYVDLCAGPGGWDLAARELGLEGVGIERDPSACQTRELAGLPTIEADIRRFTPGDIPARGLISSPPCQTFSFAGTGEGSRALQLVLELAGDLAAGEKVNPFLFADERTGLVLEPLRWALDAIEAEIPYEWIALEQVPNVLPVWELYAEILRSRGYAAVAGMLYAEAFGVPQTRKRAFMLARVGSIAMPSPTHSRFWPTRPGRFDPGVLPWISMADALGWGLVQRPSYAVPSGGVRGSHSGHEWGSRKARDKMFEALESEDPTRWRDQLVNGQARIHSQSGVEVDLSWPENRPATTVVGRDLIAHPGETRSRTNPRAKSRNDGIRVTPTEAAALQSFPAGFAFAGSSGKQYQQIGNAIPPPLATAVLEKAVDARAGMKT